MFIISSMITLHFQAIYVNHKIIKFSKFIINYNYSLLFAHCKLQVVPHIMVCQGNLKLPRSFIIHKISIGNMHIANMQ